MYSEASKRAVDKYNKSAYSTRVVRIKKSDTKYVDEAIKKSGLSFNQYVNTAIFEKIERS